MNPIACILLCLASFGQHNVRFTKLLYALIFFLLLSSIPLYSYTTICSFIHQWIDFGLIPYLAVMNIVFLVISLRITVNNL